jgi:hypothetical protein
MLTEDELFDFDKSELPDWDEERSDRAASEYPDLYWNHLTLAKWIEMYNGKLEESFTSVGSEYPSVCREALLNIAAWFRQGDFLAGGRVYEAYVDRRNFPRNFKIVPPEPSPRSPEWRKW